ncbi:unnamed protein product, partial [Dovyalis caffra]
IRTKHLPTRLIKKAKKQSNPDAPARSILNKAFLISSSKGEDISQSFLEVDTKERIISTSESFDATVEEANNSKK